MPRIPRVSLITSGETLLAYHSHCVQSTFFPSNQQRPCLPRSVICSAVRSLFVVCAEENCPTNKSGRCRHPPFLRFPWLVLWLTARVSDSTRWTLRQPSNILLTPLRCVHFDSSAQQLSKHVSNSMLRLSCAVRARLLLKALRKHFFLALLPSLNEYF